MASYLSAILGYVRARRLANEAVDAVLNGFTPPGPDEARKIVEPYAELGLTWWLERLDTNTRFSLDDAHGRIVAGSPAIANRDFGTTLA